LTRGDAGKFYKAAIKLRFLMSINRSAKRKREDEKSRDGGEAEAEIEDERSRGSALLNSVDV